MWILATDSAGNLDEDTEYSDPNFIYHVYSTIYNENVSELIEIIANEAPVVNSNPSRSSNYGYSSNGGFDASRVAWRITDTDFLDYGRTDH